MSGKVTANPDDGRDATAKLVDAAARAVPGVAELFYAAPLPSRLWRTTIDRDGAHSVVARRDDAVQVTVSIGVQHGRADDVAREVADRVRAAIGDPAAHIVVRVSRLATS